MKEKFRRWMPKGNIRIKWVDKEKGETGYWEADALDLFSKIRDVVEQFQGYNIRLTNRQLYYQLVGKNFIPNKIEVYKKACSFVTDARYGGMIDWEAIEDKGRVPEKHSEWDGVKDLVKSACNSYRLPRWDDQEYYVELYCEKQAGESVLKPVADKYHIYFGYNKGYSSASAMYELAKRIGNKIVEGKKCVILYFGDHDPSGLDMVRDIRDRIMEFLTKGEDWVLKSEDDFQGTDKGWMVKGLSGTTYYVSDNLKVWTIKDGEQDKYICIVDTDYENDENTEWRKNDRIAKRLLALAKDEVVTDEIYTLPINKTEEAIV